MDIAGPWYNLIDARATVPGEETRSWIDAVIEIF